MSNCPGLHCPGCGDKGGLIAAVGAAGGVIALVAAFAEELLVIAGTVVAAVLALAVFAAVRAYRRGWRPRTVIAWEPYTPLPEPEPVRALPAPELHLHLHGPLTREQLDEVAALREVGYRAFDGAERREP